MNFININADGTFTNQAQLNWAVGHIRDAVAKQSTRNLVIVFVHGWRHSSAASDRDVNRARDTLDWFARSHPAWHVEGVFVGWEAYTDLPWPLLYLTFWNRAKRADELGDPKKGALAQVIEAMEHVVIDGKDEDAKKQLVDPDAQNKLIFIGHSFGGRALFNATRQTFMNRLNESYEAWQHLDEDRAPAQEPVRGVGSLVILIEPAITAYSFVDLFNRSNELYRLTQHDERGRPPIFLKNDRPLLLSVTSDADLPVKIALPLSSVFAGGVPGRTELTSWAGDPIEQSNDVLYHQALGRDLALVTHRIEIDGSTSQHCKNVVHRFGGVDPDIMSPSTRNELPRGWLQCAIHDKATHDICTPSGTKFDDFVVLSSCADIQNKGTTSPFNPYWNASTHETFIQGHSEFMNQSVVTLFNQMVFSPVYTNDLPASACRYDGEYRAKYKGCDAISAKPGASP